MVDLTGYKLTFDEEFNTRSISQTGAGTTWADIRAQDRGDANADVGFGHSSFVDKGSGYDPFQLQDGALSITAVPDRTSSGVPGSWVVMDTSLKIPKRSNRLRSFCTRFSS